MRNVRGQPWAVHSIKRNVKWKIAVVNDHVLVVQCLQPRDGLCEHIV